MNRIKVQRNFNDNSTTFRRHVVDKVGDEVALAKPTRRGGVLKFTLQARAPTDAAGSHSPAAQKPPAAQEPQKFRRIVNEDSMKYL